MKRVMVIATLVATLSTTAWAQTPQVQAFFDERGEDWWGYCGTIGSIDYVYVIANDLNMWIDAIQFRIEYPSSMIWAGDESVTPLVIGTSATGVSLAFNPPLYAFDPVLVLRAAFVWNCHECTDTADWNTYLPVKGYLDAPQPLVVRWPDHVEVPVIGLSSIVCPILPTESKSWGAIKSLYKE